MQPIQSVIDRICTGRAFQASPKLVGLLRFLAAEAIAGEARAPSQRVIADAVLNLPDPESRSACSAVRMQVGRLRKLLEAYYADEGREETIRVELPLREYRLRFLRDGQPLTIGPTRAADAPVLAVTPTRTLVPEPPVAGVADALLRNLLTELGGHGTVIAVAPVSPLRRTDGAPAGIDARLRGPAVYVLDTAVQANGDDVRALAMLFTGTPPRQVWSQAYVFSVAAMDVARSMETATRRLAADVADESGFIVRDILRIAGDKPPADYSVVESIMTLWRYWITGSQDDLVFARQTLDHAVATAPDSPLALAFWAAAACQEYTSSLDPRARLPDLVRERLDAARRLALGNPWIELMRGYAMWLGRETAGLPAILDRLDVASGSATFRGMLGALRIAADIEPNRGRATVATAIAESPHPLLWFHLCAAIHDLEQGDCDAADRGLARIDAPTRPEPILMRACVASARGDLGAARRILDGVVAALPEFPAVGEIILRRWLADRHVDAMAQSLQPLGIDWFHATPAKTAR